MPRPRPFKLRPDYGCFPIWWDTTDPAWADWKEWGEVDPSSLGLSTQLVDGLHAWAREFDASLNWDDPTNTVVDPATEAAFQAQGRQLADQLAVELGSTATVRYAYPSN